ncbi:pentapeptide repeat-containing protein [Sphaerospermopsis kisseleviana]|uniref:pentapeptide repeat-containing protein n=1 Tax=Sphaerospermopsis kisseleviana TaxID=289435 RepID=UPI0039080CBE
METPTAGCAGSDFAGSDFAGSDFTGSDFAGSVEGFSPTALATSIPNCSNTTTGLEPLFISIRLIKTPLPNLCPACT